MWENSGASSRPAAVWSSCRPSDCRNRSNRNGWVSISQPCSPPLKLFSELHKRLSSHLRSTERKGGCCLVQALVQKLGRPCHGGGLSRIVWLRSLPGERGKGRKPFGSEHKLSKSQAPCQSGLALFSISPDKSNLAMHLHHWLIHQDFGSQTIH